jgi:lipopolysaccharide export system ATP-binding protein
MSPNKSALALRAVTIGKTYGKRPVVRGVDLSVHPGEIVGLLGPNGAGKTTCFSMITGLIAPDMGHIFLGEEDITHLPMYRRARLGVGYLPQDTSIFRGLNVENNILAAVELYEVNPDYCQERLNQLLDEFSITHLRQSPSVSLSGGERRRVEIARALAMKPSFLLLDEPLAGIDPIAVGEIKEIIFKLKSEGIGVLITDHNVRETLDMVDRAYIIAHGKVLKEGTPQEIISDENVRRVYLGERFTL